MTLDKVAHTDLQNEVRRLNNRLRELEMRYADLSDLFNVAVDVRDDVLRRIEKWPAVIDVGDKMAKLIVVRKRFIAEHLDREPGFGASMLEKNREDQNVAAAAWLKLAPGVKA